MVANREKGTGLAPWSAPTPPDPFLFALVESLVGDEDLFPAGERAKAMRLAVGFVESQLRSLPPLPAVMFRAGMGVFRAWVRVTTGRGFLDLTAEQRQAAAGRWAWGGFSLARQLFRGVRSSAIFAVHEVAAGWESGRSCARLGEER